MKNDNIASALIGGTFFAVPYLALSLPVAPSLLIGATAFVAGKLVFSQNEKKEAIKVEKMTNAKKIELGRNYNNKIKRIISLIDDAEIKSNLESINESVGKILDRLEKVPGKIKNYNRFFEYYLPLTVKIIERYDEIENQNLTNKEASKFMKDTNNMIKNIKSAYKKMLENLYADDLVDIDADMKVFTSMLKSDGFDNVELEVKEEK